MPDKEIPILDEANWNREANWNYEGNLVNRGVFFISGGLHSLVLSLQLLDHPIATRV